VSLDTRTLDGVVVPAPGTFAIDPAHTRVGFVARHLMVTKVRGAFPEVEGTIVVAPDPAASSAQAVLKTATLTTGNADRDTHLRSGDFFDVERFPTIRFASTRVQRSGDGFEVTGDLTIKDVTKPVVLDVEVDGVATDPWGGERLAVTATVEVDREEWGLTWNVALESGGVLVSKKIKLEIEAQAVRQA
jgi:polyisoprenoid-binding protein YceI